MIFVTLIKILWLYLSAPLKGDFDHIVNQIKIWKERKEIINNFTVKVESQICEKSFKIGMNQH